MYVHGTLGHFLHKHLTMSVGKVARVKLYRHLVISFQLLALQLRVHVFQCSDLIIIEVWPFTSCL